MTVILITRHGHVEGISPPRFRGRNDLPLTAIGRGQAERLGAHLASRGPFDAIYTSALSRCVATGEAIARHTGTGTAVMPGLVDIDYGDWTGQTLEEVERSDPDRYATWWVRPQLVRPPNGESLQDLLARTADALRDVVARHPEGKVVLVGHDSTNRALLLTLLDLPLSAYWRFEQSPCNLTEVEFSSKGVHVRSINQTSHLGDA
ncbi:histidine phosphatase family protein [Segnochrobactrum spirostomi]|uniref:Histidine phosphatase family protein n=1 Tax=Segnochrobactrum spirostomi TaxID=2608987 RepID=A0A6A7Y371_9HYPH|nr:histidine phosphatase family protein [Segnochrobactrum spirostomi]MQT12192.1 histidine phosphatase family protein [Segnochrobactrum spirostomi]